MAKPSRYIEMVLPNQRPETHPLNLIGIMPAKRTDMMMKMLKSMGFSRSLILGAMLACASAPAAFAHGPHGHSSAAEARYIANEGVLISQGKTKIMFDPLPLSGFGTYADVPQATIAKIMAGEGAYAGVDAVFISHAHRDHFSAKNMIAYMQAHRKVRLIAPKQALDAMQEHSNWNARLLKRITAIELEAGDAPQTIKLRNINATAVRIPHAGWPAPARAAVQNIVFRVTLGKKATVMHMGDADPNPIHFETHAEHWQSARTDTAFPPYWFFVSDDGQSILSNDINADKAIGVHVPLKVPQKLKDSGADYFSVFEETRKVGE